MDCFAQQYAITDVRIAGLVQFNLEGKAKRMLHTEQTAL